MIAQLFCRLVRHAATASVVVFASLTNYLALKNPIVMRHGRNNQQWLIELRARKLKLTYYHELIELGRTQSNSVELGRTRSPKLELMAEFNISD